MFLCYAQEDRDAALKICGRLARLGIAAWMDKVDLIPGQDWREGDQWKQVAFESLSILENQLAKYGWEKKGAGAIGRL